MERLNAALAYAKRTWPIFPMSQSKKPLSPHGLKDASVDAALIKDWWGRYPHALIAIATGQASKVVAVDVDIRPGGSGVDSLDGLGIASHLRTPTAHSPSGGFHLLFLAPDRVIGSSTGRLGPYLDIRGEGGSLILPPGPGRFWDPILNLDTVELSPFPDWCGVEKPRIPPSDRRPHGFVTPYGEGALDRAVQRIISAQGGSQEVTLNRESYSVGRLAAAGLIPHGLALDGILWAARQMPTLDTRRPWRLAEIERKVLAAFTDGLRCPDEVGHGRR